MALHWQDATNKAFGTWRKLDPSPLNWASENEAFSFSSALRHVIPRSHANDQHDTHYLKALGIE